MAELTAGQRVPLGADAVEINVSGAGLDRYARHLGAVLIALDASRRVPESFRPMDSGAREMRPGASFVEGGALRIDLNALPAEVDRLMLVLHILGGIGAGVTLRDLQSITTTIAAHRFPLDTTNRGEASVILVEIYRRNGEWRLSANGQGFVGGIGAVASSLNIDIPVTYPDDVQDIAPSPGGHDRPPPGSKFSGSGFAVDSRHVLTNAHVVDGARTVSVASEKLTSPAEVVFVDSRNDIALLRVERDLPAAARFRFALDLHLGEDIVVVGFPLQGLLGSGPQATAGNVSSLCGMGNDSSVMQFTAPTASGNSGGPILDTAGLVVGQVHSSLNIERIRQGGVNAENVNFGSKAPMLRTFLATNDVGCTVSDDSAQRNRADIVREARSYIYLVKCEA
ncbi:trypsin-like peptidase domain-containing protein [Sphingomonas sanxanigenens]|uniref:TerD domain-containing protein n=1 Tax=Sphingomonas sanxanigenens DSM 19645 = NX02 TaxID=1123269 RepID=W0AB33_9SPHN|nr:trypsin-like peptidase domain-containing protein [Sphingomonas sanxanigenens]AHE54316.1 hypothetical protein NX02_13090 [Sphingomonas sanxanigenens DSM 19645 = NX02]